MCFDSFTQMTTSFSIYMILMPSTGTRISCPDLSVSIYIILHTYFRLKMGLLMACLIVAFLCIGNGLGFNEETWQWKDFDKATGERSYHLPPWTSIFSEKYCAGAFLVSNDGYEKMDIILTSRSCATELKPKETYATYGGCNGKSSSQLESVKVQKVHELKCFPNTDYSDGFAIVKVDPINYEKLNYIYPIRLPGINEHLSNSGVTVEYVDYRIIQKQFGKNIVQKGYYGILADISDNSLSVQGKFPPHKTFFANVSLFPSDNIKYDIKNGMPIASQNEHGEWVLRGIHAVDKQHIFMRVDQCLKEIQKTVKEMTSVGKGLMDKINKVIPCVGQSCTLE